MCLSPGIGAEDVGIRKRRVASRLAETAGVRKVSAACDRHIVPGGPQESRKASRHPQAPHIVPRGPQESQKASRNLQAPQELPTVVCCFIGAIFGNSLGRPGIHGGLY